MDLQNQLKSLEEKIAYARQFYNDVVQKYNTQTEVVPTNIIAGLFHFEQAPYFQVDEADRQVPAKFKLFDMHVKPRPMTMGLYLFQFGLYGHLFVRPSEGRRSEKEGL